jgi:hypothetical protein
VQQNHDISERPVQYFYPEKVVKCCKREKNDFSKFYSYVFLNLEERRRKIESKN